LTARALRGRGADHVARATAGGPTRAAAAAGGGRFDLFGKRSERSLIIDGRIVRENDRLTADLTLEQIRPKSAVLRFKGHRFEIVF